METRGLMRVKDRFGNELTVAISTCKPGYGMYFYLGIAEARFGRSAENVPGRCHITFSNDPEDHDTYNAHNMWVWSEILGLSWDLEDLRASMKFHGYKFLEVIWENESNEDFEHNPERPQTLKA